MMDMKYFYYIALFLLIATIALFVKNKYSNTNTGIDIREVLAIEVEHIYFAEGKTFVELNIMNKTPGPIAFGDTADSLKKTRIFQSVTGYVLVGKPGHWYLSQFPYWNTVCSVKGGGKSKLYVVFDKDLQHAPLTHFACIFTHLEYEGKDYSQIFELRVNI